MKNYNRREFLKVAAFTGASLPLAASPLIVGRAKSDSNIRLGVIGTGDRGTWEVYILRHTPGVDVVACCDILPDHLENGLKEASPGAKAFTNYKALLDDKEIDAVLIATPLYLHYPIAMEAIKAGKHIICEKTMTYNREQAISLYKTAGQSKKVFQVCYQWMNSPLYNKVKQMIEDGDCGTITHIRCNYNRNGDWRREVKEPARERQINWRMYREYSKGLMAELCSHHINIVNWYLDATPEKITGFGGIDYWKDGRETYDNVTTIFEYPGGIKATFQAITSNAYEGVSILIMGTHGTIEIKNEEGQKAYFYSEKAYVEKDLSIDEKENVDTVSSATQKAWVHGEAIPIIIENNTKDDFETTRAMFLDFVDAVKNNKSTRSNVKNGRDAAIAVDMAVSAMDNGTIEKWQPEYSLE